MLSVDGGGIRGIIPAVLLAEIERRTNRHTADLFDLIAGTSTGGILTLGLVKPGAQPGIPAYSAAELVQFYIEQGPNVFSRSILQSVESVGGLLMARYSAAPIEAVLHGFFGETRLKEAVTPVLITSYELVLRSPFFFRSERARTRPDYDYPMRVVARATSAAPTYFPPERVFADGTGKFWALIDGGVFANNPAACAYVEAKVVHPEAPSIRMVSLGTGAVDNPISFHDAEHWGIAQWARPLFSVVLDSAAATVDYELQKLLPTDADHKGRYFRLQAKLDAANQTLDDASPENVQQLKLAAGKMIADRSGEIDEICAHLAA